MLNMLLMEQKNPNMLTREFGIRQQALYLKYYDKI